MTQMRKEDKILIARIDDMIKRWQNEYTIESSQFLDIYQRSLLEKFLIREKISPVKGDKQDGYMFFGGYSDAERVKCYLMQDYASINGAHGLSAIKVTWQSKEKELSHRDFLGSILGLGIKREKIGDIIVYEKEGYIIIDDSIKKFILQNYKKVGRINVEVDIVSIDKIKVKSPEYSVITDTVASLRCDNVVSSIFNVSRTKATEYIKRGLVFCNNMQIEKPDKLIEENDKITLRGKGKGYLIKIGDKSRKGRTYITFNLYGKK